MDNKYIFTIETEDFSELKTFQQAPDMQLALYEFSQFLRNELKYNEGLSQEQDEYLEGIKKKFWDIVEDNRVDLD